MEPFHARRAAIIYNPVARGLARHLRSLQRTTELLSQQGVQSTLIATTGPGTAGGQTREQIEAGCDLIIAAGGDGTINEVANGMLHSRVPLAIFPGGTANVLAREIGLPRTIERAASALPKLQPVRIAAGAMNVGAERRLFLCMAGAGLDAEIVARVHPGFKAGAGKLAYYACGFGQVLRPLHEFEVIVDGRKFEASFALVSRVRNYGGDLEIARGASLLANDFEIVLFRGTVSARYLQYLLGVTLRCVHRIRGCTILHGRSVSCRHPSGRQIYAQVDGELAGTLPVSADILPDALTLLAPAEYVTRERLLVAVPACA